MSKLAKLLTINPLLDENFVQVIIQCITDAFYKQFNSKVCLKLDSSAASVGSDGLTDYPKLSLLMGLVSDRYSGTLVLSIETPSRVKEDSEMTHVDLSSQISAVGQCIYSEFERQNHGQAFNKISFSLPTVVVGRYSISSKKASFRREFYLSSLEGVVVHGEILLGHSRDNKAKY